MRAFAVVRFALPGTAAFFNVGGLGPPGYPESRP
jgi:hypothetical protein